MHNLNAYITHKKEIGSIIGYEIAGTSFGLVSPSHEQLLHVEDTFLPSIKKTNRVKTPSIRMEGLEVPLQETDIMSFIQATGTYETHEGCFYGEITPDIKFYSMPKFGFINFTFFGDNGVFHRFVGIGTKYALCSFMKAHVLWKLFAHNPDLMIVHGSSICHNPTNTGIIFSTCDRGNEKKRFFGKTTTALAMVTRGNKAFSFASNDEVILEIDNGCINPFAFPNELSIMGSALESMFPHTKRPEFLDWQEKDTLRDDVRYYTTHGALSRSGYPVASFNKIALWAFVDLRLNEEKCTVKRLDSDEAFTHFREIVFDNRMALAASKQRYLGELAYRLENGKIPMVNTREYFEILKDSGVVFIKISGSVNPDEIYKSVAPFV